MRTSLASAFALAPVLAFAACACGAIAPLPGDMLHDDGGAPSSADAGGVHLLSNEPSCPREIPPLPTGPDSPGAAAIGGTSCSGSARCEYGTTSANPACNTILTCSSRRGSCNSPDDCARSDADRVWTTAYSPYGADPVRCRQALTLQTPPSGAACPTQRPAIGAACASSNLSCVYASCDWKAACSSDCFIVMSSCTNGYWGVGSIAPDCEPNHAG